MMNFLKISFVIAIFSSFPFLLDLVFRVKYVVHNEGGVLITGASTGIGRHVALHLDKIGYTVFACVRKDIDLESLRKIGSSRMQPLILDVTSQDTIDKAVSYIDQWRKDTNKPFVGIVNNAGISGNLPMELIRIDQAIKVYDVNVFGIYRVTSAFLPFLREDKGRIVNIGSLNGLISLANSGVYAGTKFALESITDATRLEVTHLGISVSLVEPGYVKTSIGEKNVGNAALHNRLKLSDEELNLYPRIFKSYDEKRKKAFETAESCETTTTPAIVHALTAQYPNTRYVVAGAGGIPGWFLRRLTWLTPDRLQDYIKLNFF